MANDERPMDEQPKDGPDEEKTANKKKTKPDHRKRLSLAFSETDPFHLSAYKHLKSQKNMTDYVVRLINNNKDKRENVIEPAPAFALNEEKLIRLIKRALSESKEENYIPTAPIQSENNTSLLQENESLKKDNSSLLEQNRSLQNERDELEKQLEAANAETAKLKSQCATLKSQLDAARAEAAQYRDLDQLLDSLGKKKPVTPTQPAEEPKEEPKEKPKVNWSESLPDLTGLIKDGGGDVNA